MSCRDDAPVASFESRVVDALERRANSSKDATMSLKLLSRVLWFVTVTVLVGTIATRTPRGQALGRALVHKMYGP